MPANNIRTKRLILNLTQSDVAKHMPEGTNLGRYMSLCYKVLCAYFDGKRYKNLYLLDGKLHFVW